MLIHKANGPPTPPHPWCILSWNSHNLSKQLLSDSGWSSPGAVSFSSGSGPVGSDWRLAARDKHWVQLLFDSDWSWCWGWGWAVHLPSVRIRDPLCVISKSILLILKVKEHQCYPSSPRLIAFFLKLFFGKRLRIYHIERYWSSIWEIFGSPY